MRRIDRLAGVPLCWCLSLLPQRRPVPGAVPGRILVIILSEVGSLVLAGPMFARLRARFPGVEVHLLLFRRNREMADLLGMVAPEHIHTLDAGSPGAFLRSTLAVLRRLRRLRFDAVVDGELFARVGALVSALVGAPIRAGFHPHTQEGLYRGRFINRPVLYNPYRHIGAQLVTLADAIDSETVPKAKAADPGTELAPLSFTPRPGEVDDIRRRLDERHPQLAGRRLVLLHPDGGALPIRAWPAERYAELTRELLRRGYAVGVVGTPDAARTAAAVLSGLSGEAVADLTDFTPALRDLLALYHLAVLLVGNDGGPTQFAAMTPLPAVVLYGPETPVLYGTLNRRARHLFSGFSCSPCLTAYNHRESPCDGDNRCLSSISAGEVLAEALSLIGAGEEPPGKEVRGNPPPAPGGSGTG